MLVPLIITVASDTIEAGAEKLSHSQSVTAALSTTDTVACSNSLIFLPVSLSLSLSVRLTLFMHDERQRTL